MKTTYNLIIILVLAGIFVLALAIASPFLFQRITVDERGFLLYLYIPAIVLFCILFIVLSYLISSMLRQEYELKKICEEREWQKKKDEEAQSRYQAELPLRNALEIYVRPLDYLKTIMGKEGEITNETMRMVNELLKEHTARINEIMKSNNQSLNQ